MESQDPRFSANLGLDQNSIWTNNLRCSHSSSLPLKKNLAQSGQLPSSFLQTFGPGSQTEPATFLSGTNLVWMSGPCCSQSIKSLIRCQKIVPISLIWKSNTFRTVWLFQFFIPWRSSAAVGPKVSSDFIKIWKSGWRQDKSKQKNTITENVFMLHVGM